MEMSTSYHKLTCICRHETVSASSLCPQKEARSQCHLTSLWRAGAVEAACKAVLTLSERSIASAPLCQASCWPLTTSVLSLLSQGAAGTGPHALALSRTPALGILHQEMETISALRSLSIRKP